MLNIQYNRLENYSLYSFADPWITARGPSVITGEKSEKERMKELDEELERETLEREILERKRERETLERERRYHRNDGQRYEECRNTRNDGKIIREWHYISHDRQHSREFSTNYNRSYNYQKESFGKPNYSKDHTRESRLEHIISRDRGAGTIVKSWSRNNL